jgi:two-component system chemotaxis sensor kinase CheA
MNETVLNIFREEACERLAALEQRFLDLESVDSADARSPIIDELFRHAHSLKGDAKAVGLPELQVAAQELEDHLDGLREAPESIDRDSIDRGLAGLDAVRRTFEQWQEESAIADSQVALEEEPIKEESTRESEEPNRKSQIANQQSEESFTVRVPSEQLDRMLNVAGELKISQRSADAQAGQLANLTELLRSLPISDVRTTNNSDSEIADCRSQIENLVDQVVRLQADHRKKHLHEELLLDSLEADIRQARLLPLAMVADSLRRAVRDLAQSLNKSIRYEIDVGDVLLDKAVIEALNDPLLHLIRNAADHGIESPEERLAAGKPEEAVIQIAASRVGNRVRITLSDDGRGVDYNRIRARIQQTEEIDEAEFAQLSESELGRFLFRPGFTTRTTSDAVSGRGVGLDVVLDSVRRLQGSVELLPICNLQPAIEDDADRQSETGNRKSQGTTFAITVPVTVSTVRVLTLLSDGQRYGIPSSDIIRTSSARFEDLHQLEGSLVLTVDGEPVRWVHLGDLLGVDSTRQLSPGHRWPFLLLVRNGQRMAVAVDDLEEEIEVLLKPLGFPLSGLSGIVGATIRPDGSVQLVLDLSGMADRMWSQSALSDEEKPVVTRRVLVVDDSPTTRALLRNLLSAAGFSVQTATDGVNALDRLASQPFDLVVSDVEMPRMNGFELTRQIKSRMKLPVILVTAMEKEEHRRQGLEAGADAYVVKSTFQDQGLLEIVKQLV